MIAGGFITTNSLFWALGNLRQSTIITIGTNAFYLVLLGVMTWSFGLMGTVSAFLVHVALVAALKISLMKSKYSY